MSVNYSRKIPFFFIIDDGGFDYALSPDKKGVINLDAYYNILKLARKFQIRIPICFTLKYLDKKNISGQSQPLKYLDQLIDFLINNRHYIETSYHGLTHNYQAGAGEFYSLNEHQPVPISIQKDHFEKSKKIFRFWGFRFPDLFVPPDHAWEQGVTDKLAAEYGVKYLVSYKKLTFQKSRYQWSSSPYLEFLPRTSLGLNAADYNLNLSMTRKIKFFPQKSLTDFVKSHLLPQNFFTKLRIQKSLSYQPPHSYMTHIGNFANQALDFWYEILDFVQHQPRLYLCHSTKEAAMLYKKHLLN